MGESELFTAISAAAGGRWSVNVFRLMPSYIAEPSVPVMVSASKTGIISPTAVTRTLAVDVTPPSVSYIVPALYLVGERTFILLPRITPERDVVTWSATGLPSWLEISLQRNTFRQDPRPSTAARQTSR